jgi:hypothetical protein
VLEIVPVTTPRQRRQFVELPYTLYAGDAHWVPPLRRDERRRLSPATNAFLAHASMDLWLATANGRVTGRIAAIDDRLHNETHRERVTWFGFFEAEDRATADRLFAAVAARARERGSRAVRGPVNPSLNEAAGLLVDNFDDDPAVLMPYNPPAYQRFVEAAGFVKVKDLLAWAIDLRGALPNRLARLAARAAKKPGLVVRRANPREFDRDLGVIQAIYREAWADNWGFVPPTDAEIRQLAVEMKPVADPELIVFAELNGRPVACAVTIPDFNQVLKRMRGNLLPLGVFHFFRRRSIIDRARMLILGVVPEARRLGLYPLLVAESVRSAQKLGYTRGECSWTLENNELVNRGIEAAGGRRYKTYRIYEKSVVG